MSGPGIKQNSWLRGVVGALFNLMAVIWFILAMLTLFQGGGLQSASIAGFLILAALMVGNALGFFVLGLGIRSARRFWFSLGYVFLAINILLTFTDQFGAWDLITLILDILLLVLLVLWHRQSREAAGKTEIA